MKALLPESGRICPNAPRPRELSNSRGRSATPNVLLFPKLSTPGTANAKEVSMNTRSITDAPPESQRITLSAPREIRCNGFLPLHRMEFDLPAELARVDISYRGDKRIRLYGCPGYIKASWDVAFENFAVCQEKPLPSGASLAALMVHGIHELSHTPEIETYLEMRRHAVKESAKLSMRAQGKLMPLMGSMRKPVFSFSPNLAETDKVELTFNCSLYAQEKLHGLANELGMEASALGVLAIGIGLSRISHGVHRDLSKTIWADVESFAAEIGKRTPELRDDLAYYMEKEP